MSSGIVEMHLKLLFDLDNLLNDIDEPKYKKIGFKVEQEEKQSLLRTRKALLKKLPRDMADVYERLKERYQRAMHQLTTVSALAVFKNYRLNY